MKKVMVKAYTQFNLGDDLFIKILCERYPRTKFILYAPKRYKSTFGKMKNIRFYHNDSLFVRLTNYIFRKIKFNDFFLKNIIRKCDAVVQIGGSLFIQRNDWEKHLYHTKTIRKEGQPYFLLGANFGPFTDKDYYDRYKEVFSEYTDVCFREKYSYELFQDLDNVRRADDIIFQLDTKEIREKNKKNVIISVIKPSVRKDLQGYDEVYYSKIRDIATYFMEKEYTVTLMSFCELEGDKEAIEVIANLIPNKFSAHLIKHYYNGNLQESISTIKESSFVVATRFHSMILGWLFNKAVFPIVYSDKMENVMSDINFLGYSTRLQDIDNVEPERVFDALKTNRIEVYQQIKNAEGHFEKLDEYLD